MLSSSPLPGLFVTGTDTGVGKTAICCAIAAELRRLGTRVGVLKPVGTGCVHRREGLVSEDAELLAHHADSDQPLDIICPVRYAEAMAPGVAARRAKTPVDWEAVQRSIDLIARTNDVIVVEGVGGVMVPVDDRHTVVDLAKWLDLPAVVVARAGLGTINHTLLTIEALRRADVRVAGVVINQYPAETPGLAEETNPEAIERWGKVKVLCLVPQTKENWTPAIPRDVAEAVGRVDWRTLSILAR